MGDVTRHLDRLARGEEGAADDLLPLVYDELRRAAQVAVAGMGPNPTLQPTALVNEAWIRLVAREDANFEGRTHFLGVAARAMRSVLVDYARRRGAEKRGGHASRVSLENLVLTFEQEALDLLALDDALVELAEDDPTLARIVELRFFGGLSHPEIVEIIHVPLRTVERGWRTARAWLHRRVTGRLASDD